MGNVAIREAFGAALVEIGKDNEQVVVISCDLKGATKTKGFFEAYPERSFEVGIAEANGIGVATGLALGGYRPFISSFGAFITGKNVEIRTSIAYNNAPVVVVGTHGGLIGPDGTTQAGLQDITTMRAMPNFIVLQPATTIETRAMVRFLAQDRRPAYLRIARNKVPEFYDYDYVFQLGRGYEIRDGSDLTIISSGPAVHAALAAAELVADQLDVRVVNLPSLKPFDRDLVLRCARETQGILTVEDHTIEGALGSIVAEAVAGEGIGVRVHRHGIYDTFSESGTPDELERHYELDAGGIAKQLTRLADASDLIPALTTQS